MMEGIRIILLGILGMIAPTLAIMIIYGLFKFGEVIGSWLDVKKIELENKRKKLEER